MNFSRRRCFLLVLSTLFICAAARADQDDGDADLKPMLEDVARAAVLKRWPDAKEIEVSDADDEDDADEAANKDDDPERADNDADKNDAEQDDADDPAAEWTLSATFESGGRDFEVLMDDEGKIKFVYEEIPLRQAPGEILSAALAAVAAIKEHGDLISVNMVLDETSGSSVQSYVVAIGKKDIYMDAEGEVTSVEDAADDEPEPEEPAFVNDAV